MITNSDKDFMKEAIKLSHEGMIANEGGPFGAVIVRNGKIIGRGSNRVTITNDPTAHAEIVAIRDACKKLNTFDLQGCIIYTSCEPCPMCLSAIYWARIKEIYYGADRIDAANIGFDDNSIYDEISKPLNKRIIPIKNILTKEAQDVLKIWDKKVDKIKY